MPRIIEWNWNRSQHKTSTVVKRGRIVRAESNRFRFDCHLYHGIYKKFLVILVVIILVTAVVPPPVLQWTTSDYNDASLRHRSTLMMDDARNRSIVKHDEFWYRPQFLPDSTIAHFFYFNESLILNYHNSRKLKPIWSCNAEKHGKIIYLEMKRAARTTLRIIFRAYTEYCHATMASVTRCLDLGIHTMKGDTEWYNGQGSKYAGKNCILTRLESPLNRTAGMTVASQSQMSTAVLQEHKVDILAGQIPIGSDEFWFETDDESRARVNTLYVAFFRRPLDRFVSETIHREQNHLSIEEAVDLVTKIAENGVAQRDHPVIYTNHLISPRQKAWVEENNVYWTPERRVNLSLANLYSENLFVGIVERIPASFDLLRFVMDGNNELSRLFSFYSPSQDVGLAAGVFSNLTKPVLEIIHQNASMYAIMEKYLEYENQIYDHALRIHEMQYNWIQGKNAS